MIDIVTLVTVAGIAIFVLFAMGLVVEKMKRNFNEKIIKVAVRLDDYINENTEVRSQTEDSELKTENSSETTEERKDDWT